MTLDVVATVDFNTSSITCSYPVKEWKHDDTTDSWSQIDASYEVGEEVTDEVIFEKFGRRAILNLRQTLA